MSPAEPARSQLQLSGAVCGGELVSPALITLEDDRIAAVEQAETAPAEPLWAVPGFVDTHTHGAVGVDFGHAEAGEVRRVLDFAATHGTTTLFASLATDTIDNMCRQVDLLAGLVESGELAGIHLEGPFLSAAKCGAHDPQLLCDPTPERVSRLLDAGRGTVRMVTLAPERTGALEAIEVFGAAGVQVAFGHSDTDTAGTRASLAAGVRLATHLFNAMRPIHHRAPGPVPVLTDDPRVGLELICDGVHLADEVIELVVDAAGWERILLITDAMAATGLSDGRYGLGALTAEVTDGVARVIGPDGSLGAIAGSTLTMDRAFASVRRLGADLVQASAASAANAAAWHGLSEVGSIEVGRRADLVLLDDSDGLVEVLRGGRRLR